MTSLNTDLTFAQTLFIIWPVISRFYEPFMTSLSVQYLDKCNWWLNILQFWYSYFVYLIMTNNRMKNIWPLISQFYEPFMTSLSVQYLDKCNWWLNILQFWYSYFVYLIMTNKRMKDMNFFTFGNNMLRSSVGRASILCIECRWFDSTRGNNRTRLIFY